MKRTYTIYIVGGILLLFLGFALGRISQSPQNQPQILSSDKTNPTPSAIPSISQEEAPQVQGGQREKATVRKVVDGDTIQLSDGRTVRYIGIDTPETVDPRRGVQCYGREASNKNKELV